MLVIAGGTPTSDIEDVRSIDSGHADLMRGGLALAGVVDDEDARDQGDFGRPIAGYGSGSFGRAFFEHVEQARTTVSHSEPITVAAEQGAIGFVVYVALLVAALVTLLGGQPGRSLIRIVAAACFVAIVRRQLRVHGLRHRPGGLGAARPRGRGPRRSARGLRDDLGH